MSKASAKCCSLWRKLDELKKLGKQLDAKGKQYEGEAAKCFCTARGSGCSWAGCQYRNVIIIGEIWALSESGRRRRREGGGIRAGEMEGSVHM